MTLGRGGREPAGHRAGSREPWGVAEVEDLPPRHVVPRGPMRLRLGTLLAATGGVALLAAGLGALGGRPSPTAGTGIAIGPAGPAPLPAYTGQPMVQPAVPCREGGQAVPAIVLTVGGRDVPGIVFVVDQPDGAAPTDAALAERPTLPPPLDIRSDVPAEIRTVGDVCAVAWWVQLVQDVGGPIDVEAMGNPTGNPLIAAQNRLSLPLAGHRGGTGLLKAVLEFPDKTLQATWRIRVLPFQPPSARLTLADQPVDLAPGCDVDLALGSGWSERVNPCFDDVDRTQEAASIVVPSAPLVFRFWDGWRVEGPSAACGQLIARRFSLDRDCRIDARIKDDALVIDPPTSAGTWTVSVSTCGVQELADTTNTICGTWYATLDVQA